MFFEHRDGMNHLDEHKAEILVIDDTPENLAVLTRMLTERSYNVHPAINGHIALKSLQNFLPDLILTDIVMPGINGFEVCERLKKNPDTRDIPVLFISALDEIDDKMKAFDVGGVDYITKPFQEKEIFARIETHLSLRRAQKELEERNARLESEISQRKQAEKKITDSIRYAELIQRSILPDSDLIRDCFPDSFIIWKPKDIVSGDIYFVERLGDDILVAVADCTGHGIPGALLTMIVSAGLRRIIKDEGCVNPAEILKRLNFVVKTTLRQDRANSVSDDGLEAAVCLISGLSSGLGELTFAGARLPLIHICRGRAEIVEGDRQSIGYKRANIDFSFSNHIIGIRAGMRFYLHTDGFIDQFGEKKKQFGFGRSRFVKLLEQNSHLPFEKQRERLLSKFDDFRGEEEMLDDVTVMGFGFGIADTA